MIGGPDVGSDHDHCDLLSRWMSNFADGEKRMTFRFGEMTNDFVAYNDYRRHKELVLRRMLNLYSSAA